MIIDKYDMFPIVGLCVETYGREAEEKKMIE
jgi:hypothetical protein